ncbi:MAG TPA: membrane dipeptidase, partial [Tahibacter sp.]|nr:membrane dipeptidase [Tahibacter sp.]
LFFYKPDEPAYAASLKTLRASGMTALMTTAGPQGRFWYTNQQFDETKQRMTEWAATIARHPDVLLLVRERADLETARRDRRVGIIYTFQGAEPLGEDLDRVTLFRDLGLRVLQLTHNRRNLVGDGCMEPGNAGLSNLGHALVERLNAEKIVVDLAHGAQRTIREGILASKKPVLISHTGCRALAPEAPRLVHDDELKLLADRGGVAGIIFWPYIRSQGQQTSADVIRHIEHAVNVAGEDHVGIGTDLGVDPIAVTPQFEKENVEMIKDMIAQGIFEKNRDPNLTLFPPDLNVANRFEVLAGLLSARGFSDARIEKIVGGNFARVMGDVWG